MGLLDLVFGSRCSCQNGSCRSRNREVITRPGSDVHVCQDCKHYQLTSWDLEICNNPKRFNQMATRTAVRKYDEAEGDMVSKARYQRKVGGYKSSQCDEYYTNEEGTRDICGPEGSWFEPK